MLPSYFIYEMCPADEYLQYAFTTQLLTTGRIPSLGFSNYIHFYVMYFVYLLSFSSLNIQLMCRVFNPIYGALTIFPFYFLCRRFTDEKNSLLATFLFAFSDYHFYRTSYFGTAEPLGILIMVIYMWVLTSKNKKMYVFLFPLMFLTFYAHLYPFLAEVGFTFIYLLFVYRSIKVTVLAIGATGLIIFIAFFTSFTPIRRAAWMLRNLDMYTTLISVKNLFIFYLWEYKLMLTATIGSIVLFGIIIYKFAKNRELHPPHYFLLISIVGVGVSWLGYNSEIVVPVRTITYFCMSEIIVFSVLKLKRKSIITLGLVCLMITSVTLGGGMQTFTWCFDSPTEAEVEAIRFLNATGYLAKASNADEWLTDHPVHAMLCYYYVQTHEVSASYDLEGISNATIKRQEAIMSGNISRAEWKFVVHSDRMARRAFFLVRFANPGQRSLLVRKPVRCPAKDDPNYHIIYEKDGVIVYERNDIT